MKALATTGLIFMLMVGLQAQIPDFTPQTPLIGALLHHDSAEATRLVRDGADPSEGNFNGFSPMMLAAVRQDVELVRLMAGKGADVNARDRSGSTALMWGAFNDTGDAAMVEALMGLGADPLASNKAGETALDWALRRGDTPAVAALRKAGASNTARMHSAAQKSLALLQQSGSQFVSVSKCNSCHHQSLPQMAFGVARSRGFELDEPGMRQQIDHAIVQLKSVTAEALRNRDRIPDPPISLSYALAGMAAAEYPPDEVTAAMAQVIAAWQSDDGAFHTLPPIRPPIESSDFTATAMSLRAIQLYGSHQDEQVARAARWLRSAKAHTTEDAAMQLLGLAWAKTNSDVIRKLSASLLALQRPDGGWAQLPTLETDAYATGQALVALQTAGHAVSSPQYQKGVGFLLRTQFPDGSWLVRTRSFPVQMPKDSGFPHGRHQWISAAGTSWATMALLLALPPQPSVAAGLLPRALPADPADGLGRHAEVRREHPLRNPGRD